MAYPEDVINIAELETKDLLLQQPPFVMIDRMLMTDESRSVSQLTVRDNHMYYEAETATLSENALMENIAQTAAARLCYIAKYVLKKNVTLGFIGAIRNFQLYRKPELGETMTTTINIVCDAMSMLLVEADICVGDEKIVETEMKMTTSDLPCN